MYNVCNSNAYSRCGCGCNTCGCGFWNGLWNTRSQSICRDCCGNIRVNQSSCGSNTCAQTASTFNTCGVTQTNSGCTRCQSNLSQLNGDSYYVRLYALNNTATTSTTSGCSGAGYNGCGNGFSGCSRNYGCGTCFGCCRNRCPYAWTVEDATDDT